MCERFGQDLDRDVAIQLRVARTKDPPHSAFADRRGDLVDAEARARGKGQCVRDYMGALPCDRDYPSVTAIAGRSVRAAHIHGKERVHQAFLPNALRSARWRRAAIVEIGGDEPAAIGAALNASTKRPPVPTVVGYR